MELPAQPCRPAPFPPTPAPSAPLAVLVVDDDPLLRAQLQLLLTSGCTLRTADNGREGLAAALAAPPDLLVIDLVMPGMDGHTLLAAVRADARIHTVPVIVLSAQDNEQDRLAALNGGADDFVAKPFNPRELVARVHAHAKLGRLRREAARREAARREAELLHTIFHVTHDLDTILAASQEAYLYLEHDLRVRAMNAAARRALDLPAGTGQVALPAALQQQLRACLSAPPCCIDYQLPGSGRWLQLRAHPGLDGWLVLGTDITDAKRHAALEAQTRRDLETAVELRTRELRQAHELLSAVCDRAPAGIVVADGAQQVVRANAAFLAMLGASWPQVRGTALADWIAAADRAPVEQALATLAPGATSPAALECRLAGPGERWVALSVSAISHPDSPDHAVLTAWDISERKAAEHALVQSELEVRRLFDILQRVREDERRALAREVHDQLGQLLTAARIDAGVLAARIDAGGDALAAAALRPDLDGLATCLDRAIVCVQDLATRLRPPELEQHGLAQAVAWHLEDFQRRTHIDSRLRCSLPPGFQLPKTRAVELFRIFQESITNVMRHAQAQHVLVELGLRGGCVLLRVWDDGRGLQRAPLDRRALGLRGMHERAALIGARLRARGRAGRGTLVAVRVPYARAQEAGQPARFHRADA